jgi:murein DD-endopeptidase MepM/ murein hydrolase activator NlpD
MVPRGKREKPVAARSSHAYTPSSIPLAFAGTPIGGSPECESPLPRFLQTAAMHRPATLASASPTGGIHSSAVFAVSLVLALFMATAGYRPAAADDLPWPIDAGHIITSTFAEPRAGRFHMGVDFTSDGTVGKEVYAIGDGFISSVTTSPFGYGKLLELRLDKGGTVRYGHLSAFLPAIEDRLETLRAKHHTYDVELRFNPGEYPVRKGNVICRSGESGSGSAHLHVEFRDRGSAAVNLLTRGLAVADTVSPEIGEVILVPLDFGSSVNGSPLPVRLDSDSGEPPHLAGRIGIAAVLTDRTGPFDQHLGVYRAELSLDGAAVFSKRYDLIPSAEGRCGGLDYLPGYAVGRTISHPRSSEGREIPSDTAWEAASLPFRLTAPRCFIPSGSPLSTKPETDRQRNSASYSARRRSSRRAVSPLPERSASRGSTAESLPGSNFSLPQRVNGASCGRSP